ncbi:BPSL0761 family protein [Pseudomonas guariconensis]|uniref:BPSL0761 family protein n=1 Tax=Pseudomonas guariconensis TaxID=1288410 RepID=UPI003AF32F44
MIVAVEYNSLPSAVCGHVWPQPLVTGVRTIATVATRQFLKNLSQDSRLPEDVKATVRQLLKHFPTSQEVLTLAKRESYLQETVGWGSAIPFSPWVKAMRWRSCRRWSSLKSKRCRPHANCFPSS